MNCLECNYSHITKKMVDYNEIIINKITCQNEELIKKHDCDVLLVDEEANTLYCPYYKSVKDVKSVINFKNNILTSKVLINHSDLGVNFIIPIIEFDVVYDFNVKFDQSSFINLRPNINQNNSSVIIKEIKITTKYVMLMIELHKTHCDYLTIRNKLFNSKNIILEVSGKGVKNDNMGIRDFEFDWDSFKMKTLIDESRPHSSNFRS